MFDRKATFRLAIQNEIMSQNLYNMLARSFKQNPAVSETFTRLVPMETLHEEKLRAAYSKEFPGSELTVNDGLAHTIDQIDINDPVKVITFAITREIVAYDIYTKMAAESDDPELVSLLKELASEEAGHKTILETEILRMEGLLTWYDPSELDGFMDD